MNILIKKAKIICPSSKHHLKIMDILVRKGVIEDIKKNIKVNQRIKTIESPNLHCSLGWLDIGTHSGEPGLEHRETLDSLALSAKRGGFTGLALMPNTEPAIDNKASVQYLINHKTNAKVKLYPIGALSKQLKGGEITEMLDMVESGAVAFSDGLKSIEKAGLLLRALQYIKRVNGIILHHPNDKTLSNEGMMHEGNISTQLGLKGIPSMAEELATNRDIELAKYADAPIVLHAISTVRACKMVKKAQKAGQKVFATVPFINLIETEERLQGFDSNYKVKPPLRGEEDRKALVKGIKNRSIQAIISNHNPIEEERKKLEFSYADKGITGLETCFAALCTSHLGKEMGIEDLVYALAEGPRSILKLKIDKIESGNDANLTVFDPSIEWQYTHSNSLSKNTPYSGKTFIGKVLETVVG